MTYQGCGTSPHLGHSRGYNKHPGTQGCSPDNCWAAVCLEELLWVGDNREFSGKILKSYSVCLNQEGF